MRPLIFSAPLLPALVCATLCTLPMTSHAAYRCPDPGGQGKIIYQDAPCPNGQPVVSAPATNPNERAAALKQAAKEKADLAQIGAARAKAEAQAAKQARQTSHDNQRRAEKCQRLAMQQKWAEQDAAQADDKKADKAKKKARRTAEKRQATCGTN